MSHNTFGHLFRVITWGESHGKAIGCIVDGAPPRIPLVEADIQHWLNRRRPGQSRYVSQRREPDTVQILSGTFEGETTGAPISLMIENVDARSKDYSEIKDKYRPGHADYTYDKKYGVRDWRGSGRASARETATRVAAGAIARKILGDEISIRGALVQMGSRRIDRERWDWAATDENPFWCPDREMVAEWTEFLDTVRKRGSSTGAVVEVVASGVPVGLGAPIYGKVDADLAAAMMSINAVKAWRSARDLVRRRCRARKTRTKCACAAASRRSSRTTPAASWAALRRARTSSCASPSNRRRALRSRDEPSARTAKTSRLRQQAGTIPAWAFAPSPWAKR